ncbi:hypothetical protein Glove_606g77 [Diversispora epigaea]|uniref:Serine-threonine/tyrosine-protein kinase catalytic domain-containing protein n=1 Tax=Diversispora epigaea TaxID=1348612 RepID=A0A397G6Y1_9GLOM|nr:hypothetical protein Glove_606g77 [Diversispora epigaea]
MKHVTDIIRWMAPEKLRDSTYSTDSTINHVPYTFEVFSFGMKLWELVFEKIPYEKWDVLAGNHEIIAWEKAPPDVQKFQRDFAKIIVCLTGRPSNSRISSKYF